MKVVFFCYLNLLIMSINIQAINKHEYLKEKDAIALYYAKKIDSVKQRISWVEWAFGYSDETKKNIKELEGRLVSQLAFVKREYVYQACAEELCQYRHSKTIDELKKQKAEDVDQRSNEDLHWVYTDVDNYKEYKTTHFHPSLSMYNYEGALQELNVAIKYLEKFGKNPKYKGCLEDLYFRRSYLQIESKVKKSTCKALANYNKELESSLGE